MATVAAFHARPDDEALLIGATLARLAAVGNRVVVVVATDGYMGGAGEPGAQVRLDELRAGAGASRTARAGPIARLSLRHPVESTATLLSRR